MNADEAHAMRELEQQEHEMNDLNYIQQNLSAPKGQWNDFSKYNYRSCEDILTALKPLLKERECTLTLNDEMVAVLDRVYVKATATLFKNGEYLASTSAFARESLSKKGMDDSQITGTASSYSRKYALNGLFAIDDTKDADTDQYQQQLAPRASHDDQLKSQIKAMDSAESVERLKTLFGSAWNYWEEWQSQDHQDQAKCHYDKLKLNFENQEKSA